MSIYLKMDLITNNDTIIFDSKFNDELDID